MEGEDNQATDTAITMSGGVFGNIAEFPTEAEQSGFVREIDHVKKKIRIQQNCPYLSRRLYL